MPPIFIQLDAYKLQDIAVYKQFKGIVLASDEGLAIAKALGHAKAALLQNHGLITCGQTVEETVFWFMSLDKCCHVQLMAEAAAGSRGEKPIVIDDEDAKFTRKSVGTPLAGWFSALPSFKLMEAESNGDYAQAYDMVSTVTKQTLEFEFFGALYEALLPE